MRVKAPHCIVTFHTTTEAMAFETAAKQQGLAGRLIPLPRAIGAGCGLAWKEVAAQQEALKTLIATCGLSYDTMHVIEV